MGGDCFLGFQKKDLPELGGVDDGGWTFCGLPENSSLLLFATFTMHLEKIDLNAHVTALPYECTVKAKLRRKFGNSICRDE